MQSCDQLSSYNLSLINCEVASFQQKLNIKTKRLSKLVHENKHGSFRWGEGGQKINGLSEIIFASNTYFLKYTHRSRSKILYLLFQALRLILAYWREKKSLFKIVLVIIIKGCTVVRRKHTGKLFPSFVLFTKDFPNTYCYPSLWFLGNWGLFLFINNSSSVQRYNFSVRQ